ncbi:MAG: glycerol-3-phosphate transporter [Legionellales bacterium RIFCSPHIGHO2_12_FULL_42_9]|nr:MAG: glycerol-3-phosphate transporter [Legionellales bacterium RIFCSPHIGHO2_12_FULL_42_9]
MKFLRYYKQILVHLFLISFTLLLFIPFYLALVAASHSAQALSHAPIPLVPGTQLVHNLKMVLFTGSSQTLGPPVATLLFNSFVMAFLVAAGKIILAVSSAFALIYFTIPGKKFFFALIFSTMMLPVEVRIVPTFQVLASFSWLNTYTGLTLPLMASATATFLFRQFFKTIPSELVDAAKLDGATPWRFFRDILLPLSASQIAALFFILFVYGWNQYLWPLVSTTDSSMSTIVMGIRYLAGVADQVPQWHYIMCVALIAMFPPCLVVLIMQRGFEKGLIH